MLSCGLSLSERESRAQIGEEAGFVRSFWCGPLCLMDGAVGYVAEKETEMQHRLGPLPLSQELCACHNEDTVHLSLQPVRIMSNDRSAYT